MRHEAHSLRFLGHVAVRRGALEEARELLGRAMELDRELGHRLGPRNGTRSYET